MEPLLAITLTFSGSVIFYLTNKNQRLRTKPLSRKWRLTACALMIFALAFWLNSVSMTAAIFIWLLTLFVLLGSCPFLALVKSARDV